jgi:TPR repeat protein
MYMRLLLLAAALAVSTSVAQADDGAVSPEENALIQLRESLAARPDEAGFACWVGHKAQKNGHHEEALKAFQICADSGHVQSMILLSHVYENGYGCDPNPELATHWVKQAALQGYSVGQYHYGMALMRGEGVPQDKAEGRFWLEQAASSGDKSAVEALQETHM